MARTSISVQSLSERNCFSTPVKTSNMAVALDANDGAEILWNGRDDKFLILVQNAATTAKTVTVKAGNGIQGVCDLTCSVDASSYTFLAIDSGRFKNVTGKDKGKVVLSGSDDNIKVAVFKLP